MAYSTIDKSSEHFNSVLYTGNTSNGHAITGVGFNPDFVWIKSRNQADFSHMLYDVVRTAVSGPFDLRSNSGNAQSTDSSGLVSFDSDGFTLNSGGYVNTGNFVSWNWKAGGSPSSNTDGSITSSVSANTTNGFSIVTYTGTGSNATIGHGLGTTPKLIFVKATSQVDFWRIYSESIGNTKYLVLNETGGSATNSTEWNNTSPTSSVFTVGSSANVNRSGATFVAYCFADVKGFSKFDSYTGNGSADGTFVYTGFKPAFIMLKNTTNAREWNMQDNKRLGYNPNNYGLFPHNDDTEQTGFDRVDFLSNGFKLRTNSEHWNESGNNFIYMAFAEAPIVGSNNVPANAR